MLYFKKNCIAFLFLFVTPTLFAQFNETIRADRPGQANSAYTVGKNVFQLQSGFDVSGIKAPTFKSNSLLPSSVLRIGLTSKFELNTAWEYRVDYFNVDTIKYLQQGLSLAAVGMRFNIIEAKNYQPAIAFQFSLKMPILSKHYNFKNIAPTFILIIAENLSDKFTLAINAGAGFNGNNATPLGTYVVNFGYAINNKLGIFLENYGNYSTHFFENRWDTGIAYLVTDNLQLDLYGGVGYNKRTLDYFVSTGISYRFVALRNTLLNKNKPQI